MCVSGVGVGLLYTAIITVVCLYFDKKRGLALGIMSTGKPLPLTVDHSTPTQPFSTEC